MRKILLVPIFIIVINSFSYCQSTIDWTKDDRNNIYEECIGIITKYKNLNQDQKESISLCYLDELTKNYTKKDYQSKIDIEVKRIQQTILTQCTKNLGINLESKIEKEEPKVEEKKVIIKPKVNEGNFTKIDLYGTWSDENSKLFFNEDGTYVIKMDNGDSYGSKWWIDAKKDIVLQDLSSLQVFYFDGKTLKYKQTSILKKNLFGKIKKTKTEIYTYIKVD